MLRGPSGASGVDSIVNEPPALTNQTKSIVPPGSKTRTEPKSNLPIIPTSAVNPLLIRHVSTYIQIHIHQMRIAYLDTMKAALAIEF